MAGKKRFLLMVIALIIACTAFEASAQQKYYISPNNKNQEASKPRPPQNNFNQNRPQNITPAPSPAPSSVLVAPAPQPKMLFAPPPEPVPNAVSIAPCTEADQKISAAFMKKLKDIQRLSQNGDRDELMKVQKFMQDHNAMAQAQDAMMRCAAVEALANYYAGQSGAKRR